MDQQDEKVRVLLITGGLFQSGGASVIIWNWYCHMNRDGIQIDFFCIAQPEKRFVRQIEENGGKCYVQQSKQINIIGRTASLPQLARILQQGRYDCVHINNSAAYHDVLTLLVSKRAANKVIIHSHSTSVGKNKIKAIAHRLSRTFLRGSNVIALACSEEAAKWFFPRSLIRNRQYTVLKNGIDAAKFAYDPLVRDETRRELGISDAFVIGHVGRFASEKNHDFLIDVFAEVHRRAPEAVLLLIGDEATCKTTAPLVHEKIDRSGLAKNVIFYGVTSQVHRLYQAMDCFVFPSYFEGFGLVAIEAQAAGLKTLCSDGIPPETKITDMMEQLELAAGPKVWADHLLAYKEGYTRKSREEDVRKAGYDITASANELREIYIHCSHL